MWECACGEGHISRVLEERGYKVRSSDIIDRTGGCETLDFLSCDEPTGMDIVTNPPYRHAQRFVEKALDLLRDGGKCAFLLRLQFLEGAGRRRLFDTRPPRTVYVFSRRTECGRNGVFTGNSAMAFAWYVWVKGRYGGTEVKWI